MIFDTHTHYDDAQFDEERDTILKSLSGYGIGNVVDVGAGVKSTARAVALAKEYPFVYAAAGVHPTETGELTEQNFSWLASQIDEKKVVAVGEIGLDYYWDCPHDTQQYWFRRQLLLAAEKDMPVIIHSRDAAADTLSIIQQAYGEAMEQGRRLTGVIHCFSYGRELAREYVKMGFFLGIGGVVTFRNARKTKEVVTETALKHLVLETDCPYLSPEPHRGERNSSLHLPFVVEEIARLKGITAQEVIRVTAENARQLYRL
ncbi:MAG: TatD family hydrolase [Lachnospiraceae bacterium]|nr:TatD family hydrolase [Lachnospiraceae bacterium]